MQITQQEKYNQTLQSNIDTISAMTKSEFIERLYSKSSLSYDDTVAAINITIDTMQNALGRGERIEIRGFGAFSLHERKARTGRNPKTGEAVEIPTCYKVHFKPGKALRERVGNAWLQLTANSERSKLSVV